MATLVVERAGVCQLSVVAAGNYLKSGFAFLALLPAIFLPQRGDVGYVMASMPSVKGKCFLQSHNSQFGMAESPLPVTGFERAEEPYPAGVHAGIPTASSKPLWAWPEHR